MVKRSRRKGAKRATRRTRKKYHHGKAQRGGTFTPMVHLGDGRYPERGDYQLTEAMPHGSRDKINAIIDRLNAYGKSINKLEAQIRELPKTKIE